MTPSVVVKDFAVPSIRMLKLGLNLSKRSTISYFKGALVYRRSYALPVRKRIIDQSLDLNFDDDMIITDSVKDTNVIKPTLLNQPSSVGLRRTSGVVKKIISQKSLGISIEEETLLELIRDLSPTPVPASEITYKEYIDLPVGFTLPAFPKKLNERNINSYLAKLTSQSYHPNFHSTVVSKITHLVKSHPIWITKENYVAIVSLLHFLLKSNVAFEVLDIMQEETEIVQDVDFLNAFLMTQNSPTVYKFRINRLESFRDRNRKINLNTWYYLFNLFESPGAKLELLNMMLEYDVPVTPVFNKSIEKLADVLAPEELTELYTQCNIQMDPFFFNTIIRSFLHSNRPDDAWHLISNSLTSSFVNKDTYRTFIQFFCEQNQLALCFAFDHLWTRVTGDYNEYTFKSHLLNEYLTECPYFPAWANIVKICRVNDAPNDKREYVHVSKRANWGIHDYAIVHNVPDPVSGLGKAGKLLKDRIKKNLKWEDGPIFKLEDNNTEFKETARLLGWKCD